MPSLEQPPVMDELAVMGAAQACLIGGAWSDGEGDGELRPADPATERELVRFAAASPAQAGRAIAAARGALDGPWRSSTPAQRSRLLHGLCDRIEAGAEDLARLLVAEIGSPIRLARGLHVGATVECLRWFADAAARGPRGGYEQMLPLHEQPILSASLLRREPAGVVAAITAYNYPLLLLARKLGGVLASGCTAVVVPSPRAPLSTIAVLRLLDELELPPGVVNMVVGGPEVGVAVTRSPDVDLISFTGSREVGTKILEQAAGSVTRVVLELGGKSPNIVLPGTDLATAVAPSILRFTLNTGQGCGATTRTLVHEDAYDEWVEAARGFLGTLAVGDPRSDRTDVGPLVDAGQRDRVRGYVERALASGASVEAQAQIPEGSGHYFEPMLLGGVDSDAEVAQHELFGPVGVLLPFSTVEEALEIAHRTPYRLNANVWGPLPEALALARRIRSGTVTINGGGGMRQDVPWGGGGQSGIGREAGEEGFEEFFEVKHVQWPLAGTTKPFGAE